MARKWIVSMFGLGLLATLSPVTAADNQLVPVPKPAAVPTDPPGTETYLANLRAWFKQHANTDDNTIGKVEAAKIYGYVTTYDHQPLTAKKDPVKKDDAKKDDSVGSTAPTNGDNTPSKPIDKTRSDYQLMTMLDKNNDEKISQDEFETWAHDYARKLAQQAEHNNQIKNQQNRLNSANLAAAERKKLEQELKNEEAQLKKLQSSLSPVHHQLQQHANNPPKQAPKPAGGGNSGGVQGKSR